MPELENAWLLALLPLPLLVYRLIPAVSSTESALRVPFLAMIETLDESGGATRGRPGYLVTLFLAWALLVIATSRPVWIGDPVELPTLARDLMIAVDISGSMDERDMLHEDKHYRRIDLVKILLGDFMQRRQGDRLGLILFADQAYLQAPLTRDAQTVSQLLREAQLGFAGQKTAIGDAIGLSVKRLLDRPAETRVLVLLTDGASNAGKVTPTEAARFAAENDIRIHTIGMGAESIIEKTLFSQRQRNPSRDLDEKTLKAIAETTGGLYFRARDSEELEGIYQQLDSIEPVEQEVEVFRPTVQLFFWPLGAALVLITLLLAADFLPRAPGETPR